MGKSHPAAPCMQGWEAGKAHLQTSMPYSIISISSCLDIASKMLSAGSEDSRDASPGSSSVWQDHKRDVPLSNSSVNSNCSPYKMSICCASAIEGPKPGGQTSLPHLSRKQRQMLTSNASFFISFLKNWTCMLLTQAHNTQLVCLHVSDIYDMVDTLPEMVGWEFHNNHMLLCKQIALEDKKADGIQRRL